MRLHTKIVKYEKKNSKHVILCFAPLNSITEEYVRALYQPLIHMLKERCSVYTLQMSLFETEDFNMELKESIQMLTDELADKRVILTGWCSGGVLALKSAEILKQLGKIADGVLLLDTFEPEYITRLENQKKLSVKGISFPAYYIHSFLLQMDNTNSYFKSNQCLADINALDDSNVTDYVYGHIEHLGFSKEMIERFLCRNIQLNLQVDAQSSEILKSIILQPKDEKVMLVKAERTGEILDEYLGWKELLGQAITLIQSNSTHDTMLIEENVTDIVCIMDGLLEEYNVNK